MTYVIYLAVFVAVLFFTIALASLALQMKTMIDNVQVKPNDIVTLPVIGPIVALVADLNEHPALADYREELDNKLIYAGAPGGGMTSSQFLATIELSALGVFIFVFAFISSATGPTIMGFLFAAVIAGLGFAVGFMWLDSLVEDRRKDISRQFPYFLDLAVMSMEAGASFLETVETFIRDNEGQAMAEEFRIMLSEIRLGKTIEESMIALDNRLTAEGVKNALKALVQGERMGTPLSQVLRDQADAIRFMRTQSAERVAEEMKIAMQGPAMLLLISVLLLILGPAIVNVADNSMF